MSTRPDDRLVNLLSHWLARHVDDDRLRAEVDAVDPHTLSTHQRDAVEELRAAIREGDRRGDLEMIVRETLESLALR
jgi:hypothetical protein